LLLRRNFLKFTQRGGSQATGNPDPNDVLTVFSENRNQHEHTMHGQAFPEQGGWMKQSKNLMLGPTDTTQAVGLLAG